MFTDSHCHLYKEYYENIDNIIKISRDNKVNRYINNGCDTFTNNEVLSLVGKYECMYGTLGIHPEYVDNYNDEDIGFIKSNLSNEKITNSNSCNS